MNKIGRIRSWLLPILAGGIGLTIGSNEGSAQPPPVRGGETTQARGNVVRMTTAPRGEVDGAMLDDGTWLHWPPHLEDRFADSIKTGDRIEATGRTETGPKGDTHFEVRTVSIIGNKTTLENPDFDKGPPPPPRHRGPGRGQRGEPRPVAQDVQARTVRGVAKRFTNAPMGEVDGVVLDNGTWLHWPPHLENRFSQLIKIGDTLEATGFNETAPRGEVHFEVESVTNVRTSNTAENPDLGERRPSDRTETARPAQEGNARREQQLRDLQEQIEKLQKTLEQIRNEK